MDDAGVTYRCASKRKTVTESDDDEGQGTPFIPASPVKPQSSDKPRRRQKLKRVPSPSTTQASSVVDPDPLDANPGLDDNSEDEHPQSEEAYDKERSTKLAKQFFKTQAQDGNESDDTVGDDVNDDLSTGESERDDEPENSQDRAIIDDGSDVEQGTPPPQVHDSEDDDTVDLAEDLPPHLCKLIKWTVQERRCAVMHGPAGSGKSHQIGLLVKELLRLGVPVKVMAPCNSPASDLDAMFKSMGLTDVETATVHRMLHLGVHKTHAEAKEALRTTIKQGTFNSMKKEFSNGVFIIDEMSMISGETLELINMVLEHLTLGGRRPVLILVGDFFQLAPVTGTSLYCSPLFHKMFGTRAVLLTELYRFKDPEFGRLLGKMRVGNYDDEVLRFLQSRSKPMAEVDRTDVMIAAKNAFCAELNAEEHARLCGTAGKQEKTLVTTVVPYKGAPMSDDQRKRYETLRDRALRVVGEFNNVKLCVGEKVVVCETLTINNDELVPNGTIGTVSKFSVRQGNVCSVDLQTASGKTLRVPRSEHVEQDKVRHASARVSYFALQPATAITVDRAQGRTLHAKVAIFFFDRQGRPLMFGDWQRRLYVACSRVTDAKAQLTLVDFDKIDQRQLLQRSNDTDKLLEWIHSVQDAEVQQAVGRANLDDDDKDDTGGNNNSDSDDNSDDDFKRVLSIPTGPSMHTVVQHLINYGACPCVPPNVSSSSSS